MRIAGFLGLLLAAALLLTPVHADHDPLRVTPDGPYTTIEAALAAAQDGDVIEVHGGVYPAPLVIDKSVAITGHDDPVIDGGGSGSLVVIDAPDVHFQGFTLRNTGQVLDHEDAGLIIQAPRAVVADNTLQEVLFGIYFAAANEGVARNNTVRGYDLDMPLRGDGIRVWWSKNVTLAGNEIYQTRDTLIWYSDNLTIEDNHFHDNRYGLHFMYSDTALVQDNIFEDNSVGTYLMYSQGLTMRGNRLLDSRGPSGYGLALKDMDEVVVEDNLLAGNRSGLYLDNSPALYEGTTRFSNNLFAYNDIGVTSQPSVERNVFQNNAFLENTQQTATRGRGTLQGNIWSQDGQGNYWSDYAGYDGDGDRIGEMAYRADKLFDNLMDTHPRLRLFLYSPATQAIDFAAAAFPALRPEPRLVDEAPRLDFELPAVVPPPERTGGQPLPLLVISLVLVGFGAGIGLFAFWHALPRRAPLTRPVNFGSNQPWTENPT